MKRSQRHPMSPIEFRELSARFNRECDYLSETSGRRSWTRNERVGGKSKSKHPYSMAKDYGAETEQQLYEAMEIATFKYGFWCETHDVGNGIHLHTQGLPPGDPEQWWLDLYGEEVGWRPAA